MSARAGREASPLPPGLYVVATPIGNLGDITLRALEVLRGVDRIACEDTRQTQKLLNHFGIAVPTVSCHEHNERERAAELIAAIRSGARIALVSDAGTPGVSDPGHWLVSEATATGVRVVPIPGASAVVTALAGAGFASGEFQFIGFLPEKAGARRTRLEALRDEVQASEWPRTIIFYEAPHRILQTLGDLEAVFGAGTRIVVARELTKLHEEFLRGTAGEVKRELEARDRIRGEFTVLFEARARGVEAQVDQTIREGVAERVSRMQREDGIDEKDALKVLARELGRSKSELYRELQRERARRR